MNINSLKAFFKKDIILTIAIVLALVSSFMVKPNAEYLNYIDYRVIILLLCLMLVVAGFKSLGVFRILGEKMCQYVKSLKGLTAVLVGLCFFFSMLITNDVSLITFVPFTISVFVMIGCEDSLIPTIVLETISANLGSMLTPIGNPQNLLLFSLSEMSIGTFIKYMLPITVCAFVLIMLCVMLLKNQTICMTKRQNAVKCKIVGQWKFWIYCLLFLVCLGNVFHLYSYWIVALVVVTVMLLVNPKLFREVDYALLLTFVAFFIFIGNMKHLESVNELLMSAVQGREMLAGVLSSQIISNVPAAMLLSGFTTDYEALLYGVNIGGLGTLIASMASLISYRIYCKEYSEQKRKYFWTFTVYNIVLLVLLYIIAKLNI